MSKRENRIKRMQRKKTTRRQSSKPETIHLLDKFSENDVKNWNETHESFESYWVPVHYHLEGLRRLHHEKIIEALRKSTTTSITLNNWCRIVDYQYSNNPLSARGSIIAGGRFNIGNETEDDVLKPISALYCAENYETAYVERFNRTYRDEILNMYAFKTLTEVREITDNWIREYNEERPHDSLGDLTPSEYLMVNNPPENSNLAWN